MWDIVFLGDGADYSAPSTHRYKFTNYLQVNFIDGGVFFPFMNLF